MIHETIDITLAGLTDSSCIKTCTLQVNAASLIFAEKSPSIHKETGSTQANLSKKDHIVDQNEDQSKHIKPLTSLHKILKFKLVVEADGQEQDLIEDLFDPPVVAEDTTNLN